MTRYFITDFRTGRILEDLPVYRGPWSDPLNDVEKIRLTLDLDDEDVRSLDWWSLATVGKHAIGVAEGDTIMAYGPLWNAKYQRDSAELELDALGTGSYWDYRTIIPLVAKALGVDRFVIPDPDDPTKTIPNPAVATKLSGLSLGTIAKRWLQQSMEWTGGEIPIAFQPDEAGEHERNFEGVDFKGVREAIRQLQEVENGPETNFQARFIGNGQFVESLFQTGTNASPLITSPTVHGWDLTAPESSVTDFEVDIDGTALADIAWGTGGRAADTVLVARAVSDELTRNGYPLFEQIDSSRTSVKEQSTLDAHAAASLYDGSRPWQTWSFKVQADETPLVGTYATGDFCRLTVGEFDPKTDSGDPFVPGGSYEHRIVGLAGDVDGEDVSVYCSPKRKDS